MNSARIFWVLSVFLGFLQSFEAAQVCVYTTPHKDVNSNTPASIVEKVTDSQQCLMRCASLKSTLPCGGAVYVETKVRQATKALCKMYAKSPRQTNSLVDVTELANNDAIYFDMLDQCTAEAQRIDVDTGAIGPNSQVVDPRDGATTTQSPGGVVIVQPGSSTGGGPAPAPIPAPAPLPPPVGPDPTTTRGPQLPAGPFVPPTGGGSFVPAGPAPLPTDGGGDQGGNGASVNGPLQPDPPPPVDPVVQPGGGVYPQAGGSYTPPPSYGGDGYAAWSAWGTCTVTCGGGVMYRNRVCGGGSACQGPDKGMRTCYARKACPQWGPWTAWGPCSSACGSGTQTRTRPCQAGYGCSGSSTDSQSCSASYGSCGNPAPQPYVPPPVYVPLRPAPQPHSYYDAIHNQYYRNRG